MVFLIDESRGCWYFGDVRDKKGWRMLDARCSILGPVRKLTNAVAFISNGLNRSGHEDNRLKRQDIRKN